MKKYSLVTAIIAVLMIVSLASCEMFTYNVYKGIDDSRAAKGKKALFTEDVSDLLAKAPVSEIIDAADNATTQAEANGALKALGSKPQSEINKMTPAEKETVLDCQMLATLGGSETTSIVKEFASTPDLKDMDIEGIAESLKAAAAATETEATVKVLNSVITPAGADGKSFDLDPSVPPAKVVTAAASVAFAAVVTSGDLNTLMSDEPSQEQKNAMEDLLKFMGQEEGTPEMTADAVAAALIPNGSKENKDTLAVAIKAISAAGGLDSLENLFGGK